MSLASLVDRLFRRRRLEQSLDAEMRFHLEERAADLERAGLAPSEAARRARLEFGRPEQYKEECRDAWRFSSFHGFLSDLRLGIRLIRRDPSFTAGVVFCLTLGIGANAAVFSWIEGTLLRPYPAVPRQDDLMVLAGTATGVVGYTQTSWPDLRDLQLNCALLESVIAEKIVGATVGNGDRAVRAIGSLVSANYFDSLGIKPFLGRGFAARDDEGRAGHPEVVISYQQWMEAFRGDPAAIGRTQMLNNRAYTIVGVAPRGFYGTFVGYAWQFWVPASMQADFDSNGYLLEDRASYGIRSHRKRRHVTGDKYFHARLRTSSIKKSATCADTRPYGFPSSITAGESAQFPRQ